MSEHADSSVEHARNRGPKCRESNDAHQGDQQQEERVLGQASAALRSVQFRVDLGRMDHGYLSVTLLGAIFLRESQVDR